jgi:hypothetical protein
MPQIYKIYSRRRIIKYSLGISEILQEKERKIVFAANRLFIMKSLTKVDRDGSSKKS